MASSGLLNTRGRGPERTGRGSELLKSLNLKLALLLTLPLGCFSHAL